MSFFVLLCACSANNSKNVQASDVSSKEYSGFRSAEVNEITLLPVFVRKKEDRLLIDPDSVLGIPDYNSTKLLASSLINFTDFEVNELSDDQLNNYTNKNGLSKEGLFKLASQVAKDENTQNVLFALVDEKDSRTGGKLGSERPTSVSYWIWLYNKKQEKIIWSSAYSSNETALTENLFELKEKLNQGFSFKTNDELLKNAFRATSESLERDINKIKK